MRISDWSSDVCSSDLLRGGNSLPGTTRFIANSINWLPHRYGRNIAGDCRLFLLGGGACPHRSIRLKARPRRQASESLFGRSVCISADTAVPRRGAGAIKRLRVFADAVFHSYLHPQTHSRQPSLLLFNWETPP